MVKPDQFLSEKKPWRQDTPWIRLRDHAEEPAGVSRHNLSAIGGGHARTECARRTSRTYTLVGGFRGSVVLNIMQIAFCLLNSAQVRPNIPKLYGLDQNSR